MKWSDDHLMGSTVGVIVEYNPLHNGHVYHLQQARCVTGAKAVVAVMSGHWMQRGEPAFMNKWARAETALHAGVDLVLELPVLYSTQPAEWFAYGAVSVLEATGVVDALCFGSESGRIEELAALAERMSEEPEAFASILRDRLREGVPYPAAYAAAARHVTGLPGAGLLAQPNNSLGFHYLLALARLNSRMKPYTIQRVRAGYHDAALPEGSIASATALRAALLEAGSSPETALARISSYVPEGTLQVMRREWETGRAPMHWERYRLPLWHRLLQLSTEQLADCREMTEGLEFRIKKTLPSLGKEASVDQFLELLKTKRYTRTKLQRLLTAVYLGHMKKESQSDVLGRGAPYLRVLGFTDRGRSILQRMKETAAVPVITSVSRDGQPSSLALDVSATAAYALGYADPDAGDWFADYYHPPVRVSFSGNAAK